MDPRFEGQNRFNNTIMRVRPQGSKRNFVKKPRDCVLLDFVDYRENTGESGFPQGIERVALPLRIANCADVEGGLLISSDRI